MHTVGHMEKRMDVLQCAKQEMACKIAELGQATALRGELEHRLFDLNASLKQLKARQYELHQLNINAQCERLQASKQLQQCQEQIQLGIGVAQQIEHDIAQHQKQAESIKGRLKEAYNQKETIELKIKNKQQQINDTRKLIQETDLQQHNLKKLHSNKQEMLVKLRQSLEYYANKDNQLQNHRKTIEQESIEQIAHAEELQTAIKNTQQHLHQTQITINANERDIIDQKQKIDSQHLKKKVLTQKWQILSQRLSQVKEEQIYAQKILQAKKATARDIQEKRNTKRSAWLAIRDRFGIELEYASRYCQKLTY